MKIQAAAIALVLVACSKTEEPKATTTTTPTATATATTSATATATTTPTTSATATAAAGSTTDIAWDVPAKWTTAPNPSPMRKATYKTPKAAGDTDEPEVSVSQAGGDVDSNVARWSAQLGAKDAKRTKVKVGSYNVTIVEVGGTFQGGGMPGTPAAAPKPHWALLGAIVEGVEPPYFFKMTGPEKSVAAARGDFDKLVGSVHAK